MVASMVQICKQKKKEVNEILEPVLKKTKHLGSMNAKDLDKFFFKEIQICHYFDLKPQITFMTSYLQQNQV